MVAAGIMRQQLMRSAREANVSVLDNYKTTEEKELETYETVLKLCMNYVEGKEEEKASIEEINEGLSLYLDGFIDLYAGDAVKIFGLIDGHMISNMMDIEKMNEKSVDYKTTDWYQGVQKANGNVYITDAYEDEETGKTMITMVKKAKTTDSIIGFDIFFDYYHGRDGGLNLPANGAYYLCDQNGKLMYHDTYLYDSDAAIQEIIDKILPEADNNSAYGYIKGYPDRNGNMRSVYTRSMDNGWTIIMTVPQENAIGDMNTFYITIGALALLGTFMIICLAVRDYKREMVKQKLLEERREIEHTARIYQKAIQNTAIIYREIHTIDFERDEYEMIYPICNSKEANGYSDSIEQKFRDQTIVGDNCDEIKEFLSANYIQRELQDKDHIEMKYRRKAKEGYEWCVTTFTAAKRKNGVPVAVTMTIRSIDEIMQQEEKQKKLLDLAVKRAEAANNAKSDFLSNMSHDIRTPMNAILGMTAIATIHIDDKERVMDALNKITLSGKHLLGLINSILDMSKIESGKISLREEEFNLSDTVEGLMSMLHTQMEKKKLNIQVNIAKIEHEDVIGDDQHLSQILVNIMSNAIKFTPEGGNILLRIKERTSDIIGRACYEFVFEDTGIGMEESFVDKIFEPFARAADSRTTRTEGTGLGMSIALNIAKMMGGDIQVESELGKGSKFTVTVYLKINHVMPENIGMLKSLPVLVVDDEAQVCESTCEILNSLDMQVQYVLDGDDAVEKIKEAHMKKEDFSVVILDWKMPKKNGLETTREIRRIMGEEIPIIILSAYDWSEIEEEATRAGVNAFTEKPLFKSRLTHVLKEVLGVKQENRQQLESLMKCDYSGRHVLLVDDNELNIEVAGELLGSIGLDVDYTYNGKQAVERLEEMPADYYDMVFMDIQMPVMNGYEAARVIRSMEHPKMKEIPIIAMTADAFTEDVKKAHAAGMNGHIAKPVDISKLEKTIEEWFCSSEIEAS
jgi:signal transduction histidine kinase/CheY-like chemotaxis protein